MLPTPMVTQADNVTHLQCVYFSLCVICKKNFLSKKFSIILHCFSSLIFPLLWSSWNVPISVTSSPLHTFPPQQFLLKSLLFLFLLPFPASFTLTHSLSFKWKPFLSLNLLLCPTSAIKHTHMHQCYTGEFSHPLNQWVF